MPENPRLITAETLPNPNRPAVTLSVAMILTCIDDHEFENFRRLVLVRNQKGLWSLPAGGKMPGETATDAAMREACEETGLPPKQITITNNRPHVMLVERLDRTRVGLIFEAETTKSLPRKGRSVKSADGETCWVKAVGQQELYELIRHPERWSRPEMNLPLAIQHLNSHWDNQLAFVGGLDNFNWHGLSFPDTYLDGQWLGQLSDDQPAGD